LHQTRKIPEFDHLALAFKRAANILRQADWKGGRADQVDPSRFQQNEESGLWQEMQAVEAVVANYVCKGEFEAGLKEMVRLKEPLDRFFDKVMVMAEDPALKQNRLALLSRLRMLFASIADLSKLQ